MKLQANQRDVLQTIVAIQGDTDIEEVEDSQIAEEMDVALNLVRNALKSLEEDGYVRLEKIDTLSGTAYSAVATSQGRAALGDKESLTA